MPNPDELGTEIATIELRAGEISLHHGLMWHRSGHNETNATRHSLIQRYADGSSRYSGKIHTETNPASLKVNAANVGKRLDELDIFPVFSVDMDEGVRSLTVDAISED
jgi:hypothetical protein